MKKFYVTPAVEFTGFDVEDVITVSIKTAEGMTEEQVTTLKATATAAGYATTANDVLDFGAYQW